MDLQPTIDMMWDGINCFDDFIYGMIGYHFTQWPDSIMNRCFYCNKRPFEDAAAKLRTDFNKTIPRLLGEPKQKFYQAGKEFKSVFT